MAQETEHKLRKIQFTKALRGYSCEEVDTYLDYVNDRYGALAKECSELKKKMAVMAAGQNEFREDALREKEKIAAEADALVQEKQAAAGKLMEEARRKAARILSDAETAAAGILQRAEAEAGEALSRRQEEDQAALEEAGRKIAQTNNAADRLVEEIDSFREEVFAMYAKHIEELERLSKLTDAFYQTKEELSADVEPMDEEPLMDGEPVSGDADPDEEMYLPAGEMPLYAEDGEPEETAEEPEETADDLLRIDWKKHRASRDAAESEEMAAKTLWEIADEANDAAAENDLLWDSLTEEEEAAEEPAEEDDTDDFLPEDFDLLSEEPYEASDDEEDFADDFEETYEPEEEDEPEKEISEEDFLSDIANEYITPSRKPQKAAEPARPVSRKPDAPAVKAKAPQNLDELLSDETKNVGLTGEFDIIFNSKKSAANVNEISRQPLMEAQKPEKPKKHSK